LLEHFKSQMMSGMGGAAGGTDAAHTPETGGFPWTTAARQRLETVPAFLRPILTRIAEDCARERGHLEVNVDVLATIREVGIVPVIRAESPEAAGRAIDAIRAGGVPILEITMTVPGAVGLIEDIARKYGDDAVVGAGTVLDPETARACLELGLYISFAGMLTYKKSQALRDLVKEIPLERIVVETDAPYLAPQPMRGKRNEPSFVRVTANALAELAGTSQDEFARQSTANACRLFGLTLDSNLEQSSRGIP
jgi:hypothetical protein